MSYPNINLGSFLFDEKLKSDGSNFINWYQRLRDTLDSNNLLYVIYKTVRRYTRDSAGENDNGDYHDRRSLSIEVQNTMLHSMESELRVRFSNTDAYEMVDGLKALFASQVRIMKYELRDKFLSAEMEENSRLESHLATMQRIHGCLTRDLDYWMTDEIAIDGVLCSLPFTMILSLAISCKENRSPSMN